MFIIEKVIEIPNQVLDLQGEVCPFTYVRTKQKLEIMTTREIVDIIFDHEPAIENVPRSVKSQNLGEILEIKKIAKKKWQITIQKS